MIIPWNTDAPLYHFPFATIALIVVNTAAFLAALASDNPEQWMLAFGEGLQPQQWVTNVFMHIGLGHLVGNMIFLWGFGLVIEGKVGWWRFLLLFLGLGVFQSAVVQACMQHRPGYALGASGAIYGLLAMSLIWAPRNDMNCVGFFGMRLFHFDLPILSFVTLYVVWELFSAWWTDFEMSSSMLHLAGAIPGFVVAIAMLKLDLVDCEQWDVFTVLAGREGQQKERRPDPRKTAERQQLHDAELAAAHAQLKNHLTQGRAAEALAVHQRMSGLHSDWQLSLEQLMDVIKGLHREQLWSLSVLPMVEYLRRAPDTAPRVRLKLAQILIVHENRPGRALGLLEKIPADALPGDLQQTRRQLQARAETLYDQGELEVESEDW